MSDEATHEDSHPEPDPEFVEPTEDEPEEDEEEGDEDE